MGFLSRMASRSLAGSGRPLLQPKGLAIERAPAAAPVQEGEDAAPAALRLRRAMPSTEPEPEAARTIGAPDEHKDELPAARALSENDDRRDKTAAPLRRLESQSEIRDEPPNEPKPKAPSPISQPDEEPGRPVFRSSAPMGEEETPPVQRMPGADQPAAHSHFLPPISSVPEEEERKRESSVLQTLRRSVPAAVPAHVAPPAAAQGLDLPADGLDGSPSAEPASLGPEAAFAPPAPVPAAPVDIFHPSPEMFAPSAGRPNVVIDRIDVLIHEPAAPARDTSGRATQRTLRARYLGGL